MKSLKSITIVVPYPVTLTPVPTILISVKPTPTLFATTPDDGLVEVDPIPTPPPPSSPQEVEYPSKLPIVLLYLISPAAGDEFL